MLSDPSELLQLAKVNKSASNNQGAKFSQSEFRQMVDKAKNLFNEESDDAILDAASDEIDEGFLQVTAYNRKPEDIS